MVEAERRRRGAGAGAAAAPPSGTYAQQPPTTFGSAQNLDHNASFEAEVAAEMQRLEANLRQEAGLAAPPLGKAAYHPPSSQPHDHQPPPQQRYAARDAIDAAQDHLAGNGGAMVPDQRHDFSEVRGRAPPTC